MHLSADDAALFYKLMFALQFDVSQQLALTPTVTSQTAYRDLDQQAKLVVRDALYEHPALIDRFVAENPAALAEAELAIVASWQNFVAGDFYIERYVQQASIWIAAEPPAHIYRVVGISQSLEEIIDRFDLPLRVSSVLLPFKGQIIYDGLLSTYKILFGTGVKSSLREEYRVAKQHGQIIESLAASPQQNTNL